MRRVPSWLDPATLHCLLGLSRPINQGSPAQHQHRRTSSSYTSTTPTLIVHAIHAAPFHITLPTVSRVLHRSVYCYSAYMSTVGSVHCLHVDIGCYVLCLGSCDAARSVLHATTIDSAIAIHPSVASCLCLSFYCQLGSRSP